MTNYCNVEIWMDHTKYVHTCTHFIHKKVLDHHYSFFLWKKKSNNIRTILTVNQIQYLQIIREISIEMIQIHGLIFDEIMPEQFNSKYCIYFRALNQNWFNILENKKRYVLYIVVGSNDLFFSLDHENILNFSHHFFHCFWARICDRFYQFYGNRKKEELAKSSAIQNGIHVYLNSQFKRFKRYLLLKMKCKQRHINENNCHLSQYLKSRTLFLAVI